MKIHNIALLMLGAFLFGSCGSNTKTAATGDSSAVSTVSHSESEHTYACPMHPEVIGKEGDTCPKCGMKLEHNDNAGKAGGDTYFMDFSINPSDALPGKQVMLKMTPKIKGKEKNQVGLAIEHTKKIHLIVVSDDLSYFDHIHPEYGPDGSYTVNTKFPASGKYTLFADFKPIGGNHTVDKLNVDVSGTAPVAKVYQADKLTSTSSDGFSVMISPDGGKFITNSPMHISGSVQQNGKPVDPFTLEDYLGAKAHMVVVSLNDKEYLHVHPGVKNGKFDLHTTFEKPGVYRGWIQFQSKGKVHTVDFIMNVKKGSNSKPSMNGMGH